MDLQIKEFGFRPSGVCCKAMKIKVLGDTLIDVEFIGGCPGNAVGLCKMLRNQNIKDVINQLKGIPCKEKSTSCPDQLARALEEYNNENN